MRTPHPLQQVFDDVIEQVTEGKGSRHGGGATPFYEQQWVSVTKHHGIGFLTGQAVKKLNEAALKRLIRAGSVKEFEREVLGAIAYAAMAVLAERGFSSDESKGA